MKRIGLVVAVEEAAVHELYGEPKEIKTVCGVLISIYERYDKQIIMASCGMGTIASSAATMLLIDHFKVDTILNFGVVGALSENYETTAVAIIEDLVNYEFDVSGIDHLLVGQHDGYSSPYVKLNEGLIAKAKEKYPDIPLARIASGNSFITGKRREELHNGFDADLCDMELAGIFYTADKANVPVFSIKCVSDGIEGVGEDFYKNKEKAALLCFKVLDSLLQ